MFWHQLGPFVLRFALFFGFWLLLLKPVSFSLAAIGADYAVGALAAAGAAVLSLHLLPPDARIPRPWQFLKLGLRFMGHSLVAGIEVSGRALDPRLPLNPGFIRHPTRLPPGPRRELFGALTSQVPGTLAVGTAEPGVMLYHSLDVGRDQVPVLAADEALFIKVFGADSTQGAGQGR